MIRLSGQCSLDLHSFCLTPSMMASVDTAPFFSTDISTERLPSTCTMFVCGG